MAKTSQSTVVGDLLKSDQLSSEYFQLKLRDFFEKHNLTEAPGDLETLRELAAELLQDTFVQLSKEGLESEATSLQIASLR